jgi:hypothetical protein
VFDGEHSLKAAVLSQFQPVKDSTLAVVTNVKRFSVNCRRVMPCFLSEPTEVYCRPFKWLVLAGCSLKCLDDLGCHQHRGVKEMKKVLLVLALVFLAVGAVMSDGFESLPISSTHGHVASAVPHSPMNAFCCNDPSLQTFRSRLVRKI